MVGKTTVRWITISLQMSIGKIILIQNEWQIGWIPFAGWKFRPTDYHSQVIGG
jgi:hypothetical protein